MNTDNNGFVFRTTALIASVAMNVLLSLAVPATSAAETTAANRAAANVSDPAGSVFQDRGDQPPGALRVSAQGHWLEFRGRPFVPVGDSLTQGWMEQGTDFDQQAYLDALARWRINAGHEYVLFVPDGARFAIDLSDASGMMLSVTWFDPASGALTDGGEVAGGGSAERLQPPFARDAVLHLRRRA